MTDEEEEHLRHQTELSKSLSLGFVCLFFPVFGFVAMVIGWRALAKIQRANDQLVGATMAKVCLGVGLLETIFLLPAIIHAISKVVVWIPRIGQHWF